MDNEKGLIPGDLKRLIAAIPTSSIPSQQIVQTIIDAGVQILGVSNGLLYFADLERKELICLAHHNCAGLSRPEERLRYAFDATSFASEVYRSRSTVRIKNPWADLRVDQRGVRRFNIKSELIGVPLINSEEVLGVTVFWDSASDNSKQNNLNVAEPFSELAANLLATSFTLDRESEKLRQLPDVLSRIHEKESQEEAIRAVLEALGKRYDRVRFYKYSEGGSAFIPVDCWGMDRDAFLKIGTISTATNPYARDTVAQFPANSGARTYHAGMFGPDPDADRLRKPNDQPWVVVPLGINGEMLGQIVADNVYSGRAIEPLGFAELDTLSAVAVSAIASRRDLQFLSLTSLPELYKSLSPSLSTPQLIRRLLVYLTCGEALAFSRAFFMEIRKVPDVLTYRFGLGSLDEQEFRRIGRAASLMPLASILKGEEFDYEIHQAMSGFTVSLAAATADGLVSGVVRRSITPPSTNTNGASSTAKSYGIWAYELAARIGETEVVSVPVFVGECFHGLFIADRRWQPRPISAVDAKVLGTFSQIASQIISQHQLHRRAAQREAAQQWEGMGSIAAHEVSEPVACIDLKVGVLLKLCEDQPNLIRHLEEIRRDVAHLKLFLGDFKAVAHPKTGEQQIDLRDLIQQSCDAVRFEHSEVGFEIDISFRDTDLYASPSVLGDPERLRGCFTEILTNSVRAFDKSRNLIAIDVSIPPQSWLPPSLDSGSQFVLIHFSDNGKGIPVRHQRRIYEPAFTTRPEKGGSGIGLFMVQRVVSAHGGLITNYGREGRGTTFAVFLPLSVDSDAMLRT